MLSSFQVAVVAGLVLGASGCTTSHVVQVEPVKVEPIEVTMDVHVKDARDKGADAGKRQNAEGDATDAPPD